MKKQPQQTSTAVKNSAWTTDSHAHPPLQTDTTADVVVVGAGITGLTAAYLLSRAGRQVVVVDSGRIAGGTSGGTTAHLTTDYDHDYDVLIKAYDLRTAKLVEQSLRSSIEQVDELQRELGIDCDFRRVPGYYYSEDSDGASDVRRLLAAYQAMDLPADISRVPLPMHASLGMTIPNQAKFNPVAYLHGLAENCKRLGRCRIYEHTQVVSVDAGDKVTLTTAAGHKLEAQDVILATHIPIGRSVLDSELVPMRSYVLAVSLLPDEPLPQGLFWDTAEPYHYIRTAMIDGTPLVLVGGCDHRTGEGQAAAAFAELETYARQRFRVASVPYQWSAQLYDSTDHLPFIGLAPGQKHVRVATGFGGDGMTLGSLAGSMLSRQLLGEKTEYDDLYRPGRISLAGFKQFLHHNIDVAKHMVLDRLAKSVDAKPLSALAPGEGTVVDSGLTHTAAFRGQDGELRQFSAVCSHMGGIVRWNGEEQSFDCPCHGARFSSTGEVLEGPATKGLTPLAATTEESEATAPKPSKKVKRRGDTASAAATH